MSNERNIEITTEMLEAVALAQLYREDATLALRKIITAKLTSKEMTQLYKDILGGNKVGIKTILVNPMSKDDMFFTKLIFRPLESIKYKKLAHNKLLVRGKYYE